FLSVGLWAAVLVVAVLSAALPPTSVRARAALVFALSLAVLWFAAGVPAKGLLAAVCSAAWVMASLRVSRRMSVAIVPGLVLWVPGKLSGAFELPRLTVFAFAGFSFFFVKAWTLAKDVRDGRVESPDPLVVLAYFFFFPTWISGPMHLFGEFDETFRAPRLPDK